MMRKLHILMAGGGSGGHVTPLVAVARELRRNRQDIEITLITDRAFFSQTKLLAKELPLQVRKVYAGKYRRYHGKSFFWHVTHLPTVWGNLRDIFFLGLGTLQSGWYFLWHRPDIVFCKGGYVCVPIGLMAKLWNIPLIIHDSDTHPGLTNRFLSRWAKVIATGMPPAYYEYAKDKMVYSGIPVNEVFQPSTSQEKRKIRHQNSLTTDKPLLLVTGGGTGAVGLNVACVAIAPQLLKEGWEIVHITGKGKGSRVFQAREQLPQDLRRHWHIHEFKDITGYVQAADIIVSRAGATAMQEFANAKKTVVVVPNPHLTGGHQLKNAAMFAKVNAVEVLSQEALNKDPSVLYQALHTLRATPDYAQQLAHNLWQNFAKPQAAADLAVAILQQLALTKEEGK